jgi:spore photoproduct lyase
MKMTKHSDYQKRFDSFSNYELYRNLEEGSRNAIKDIGMKYQLTYQELRQLTDMAVDFVMWDETSIGKQWNYEENSIQHSDRLTKKKILRSIHNNWEKLKENATNYDSNVRKREYKAEGRKLKTISGDNAVFGMCPVASEKTVCCNLRTIDVAQGCGLGCSYCSIQTFYEGGTIAVEDNLADKLAAIELDPNKNYHIGSGQSSDSLALGNKNGILDAQLEFARNNPNIILEFKTKSKNVKHLLQAAVPSNIFVSWSMTPQVFIDHEEARTATIEQRLQAARQLADAGIIVGFHFHPIIYYHGWNADYNELINRLKAMFSAREVGLISFGTLTFIKPAIKSLRMASMRSKILQMPFADAAGKISYPMETKKKIFSGVWDTFQSWQDEVFFYFCMEDRQVWESVFGRCYETNEDFEQDLFTSVSKKLQTISEPINSQIN